MSSNNSPTTSAGRGHRRAHTKSSNGCMQCKSRRVKCDERHPTCSRCTKRNELCSFQNQTGSHSLVGSSVGSSPGSSGFEDDSTRAIELRLMHQYSTSTSILLSHTSRDMIFHNSVMVKFALSNSFLLDAMFATAAIHLSTEESNESQFWIHTALLYHNRAIAGLKDALKDGSSNPDALALCSISMVMNSGSLSGVGSKDGKVDGVEEMIRMRNLLQGAILCLSQTVKGALWTDDTFNNWKEERIAESLKPSNRPYHFFLTWVGSENTVPGGHWGVFFNNFSNFAAYQIKDAEAYQVTSHKIEEMTAYVNTLESDYKDDYLNACLLLKHGMEAMTTDRGNIYAWSIMISEPMITLLEAKDDIASLIFIHYGVVLYQSTLHCFSNGAGKDLVESLTMSLKTRRPEWIEVLNWARDSVMRNV